MDSLDRRIACRLIPRLIVVRLSLTTTGYASTREFIERNLTSVHEEENPTVATVHLALRAGRVVNGLGRRMPFDATCLVRSLATWWFVRGQGLPAELKIGVIGRREFAAHAWVELFGEPITDSTAAVEKFTAFNRSGP